MLHYNENKVAAGEATLLLASGFAGDVGRFSLEQKLQRFQHLTMLNSRVKTNAVHITLNFDNFSAKFIICCLKTTTCD